jgi:elongation factor P
MITVSELRKGVVFEDEGQLWKVLEYDHYKPGRGNAMIRTKLRNIRTGSTVSRTFLSGERVQDIRFDHKVVQYLYTDGEFYHFMDTETFEQPALAASQLSDVIPFLKEGTTLELEIYEGEPVDISLPITVDLRVADAPPGYAGDTATSASKEVILETGYKLQVPLFVKTDDVIRIDTRTGQYLTRV